MREPRLVLVVRLLELLQLQQLLTEHFLVKLDPRLVVLAEQLAEALRGLVVDGRGERVQALLVPARDASVNLLASLLSQETVRFNSR